MSLGLSTTRTISHQSETSTDASDLGLRNKESNHTETSFMRKRQTYDGTDDQRLRDLTEDDSTA